MNRRGAVRTIGGFLTVSAFPGCLLFGAADGGRGYDLSLDSVTDDLATAVALGPGDYTAEQRRLVSEAVSEGKARVYGYEPIDDGTYVEYEGAYYRMQVEETGEKRSTRTVLLGEPANASEVEGDAVEMTVYPRRDLRAVKHVVAAADEADGGPYVLHGRSADESALLPKPKYEYVRHGDQYVRLVVEERRVTQTEFTYTVERVASSESEFRRFAVQQKVTATYRSAKLSDERNQMLRKAIEDYYGEFEPLSDGYRELLERLGTDGELPEGHAPTYVEYDGTFYRATVAVSVP